MKKLYLTIALSLLPAVCGAETIHLAHGGTGDGTSCSSARDEAWFAANTAVDGTVFTLCDDGGALTDLIINEAVGQAGTIYFNVATGDVVTINSTTYGLASNVGNRIGYDLDGDDRLIFTGSGTLLRFFNDRNISLKNFYLNSETATNGIQFVVSTYDVSDVTISGVTVTLSDSAPFIRLSHYGANSKNFYDWSITNNYVINAWGFIFGTADADVWANGMQGYNFDLSDNRADHLAADFVAINSGLGTNGGAASPSTIAWNRIYYCGDSDSPNANCFQLMYLDGTIVEHNYVGENDSSVCDGAAYILDWANSDADLYSRNVILRYNVSVSANAACGGKSYSIYRAFNSQIYGNVSLSASLANFRQAGPLSTGNTYYNNVGMDAPSNFWINSDSPASTWKNNIGSGASVKGFRVDAGGVEPTESYNAIWGAPANDITLDATDITDNPYLSVTGKPTSRTPSAVKRGGTLIDGAPSIAGRWAYLGAYPYYDGVVTPWNIALSISGGPGRIGGGVVYNAPAEYLYFGSDIVYFGSDPVEF